MILTQDKMLDHMTSKSLSLMVLLTSSTKSPATLEATSRLKISTLLGCNSIDILGTS